MKQIIVVIIKESKNDQKSLCRILTPAVCWFSKRTKPIFGSRALQIAVGLPGVEQAALGGTEKDKIEVSGDGIDAVELTNLLRKKVGYATIISITPVWKKEEEPKAMGMVGSYGMRQCHLTSITPVGDKEDTEVEQEILPIVSSNGVPDQHQVCETRDANLTSITPVGDSEDTEMEPEMMPMVSSIGVPDQVRVFEMRNASPTSITPVVDNEDTEVEPEMLPMVISNGVPDQYRVYEMRDASLITQYNNPYGRVNLYIYFV